MRRTACRPEGHELLLPFLAVKPDRRWYVQNPGGAGTLGEVPWQELGLQSGCQQIKGERGERLVSVLFLLQSPGRGRLDLGTYSL
jgi:hypothetical protein